MNHRTHAHAQATAGKEQGLGIDEVTARAGVSERLVRHCEERGLIPGAEQADAFGRLYTHEDVCVLRFARRAHVLGFGMKEVAKLLYLWQDMHRVSATVKSSAMAPPKALESGIDELLAMRCFLERLTNLFAVEHQPVCPILEALMAPRACYALLESPQIESGLGNAGPIRAR